MAGEPSVTLLPAEATTALGCGLLAGLPLPDPLDIFRLEFPLDGQPFAVHVSADGSLTQACDARWPNLGAGAQWVARADADSDGDGWLDAADDCPDIAGSPASRGCPLVTAADSDGDGVPDSADRCARQAGAEAAAGCALLRDSDGDGVPDHIDVCGSDFGAWRADLALGCPADGSGSSTRRRGAAEVCTVSGADAALRASGDAASAVVGRLAEAASRAVIGRSAGGDWLQLAAGWVRVGAVAVSGRLLQHPAGQCRGWPRDRLFPAAAGRDCQRAGNAGWRCRRAPQRCEAASGAGPQLQRRLAAVPRRLGQPRRR